MSFGGFGWQEILKTKGVQMSTIGEYLKDKRKSSGRTQRQVARHLGYVSSQYISNVERGGVLPSLRALKKWTNYIGANRNVVSRLMTSDYQKKARNAVGAVD